MGITFIGNPYDQEAEYDDSDLEMNAVDGMFDNVERAVLDIIPRDEQSSGEDTDPNWAESNEDDDDSYVDYNPDDDNNYDLDYEVGNFDPFPFEMDDDEDEDIDYVTYPLTDQNTAEQEKTTTTDTTNPGENSDTD